MVASRTLQAKFRRMTDNLPIAIFLMGPTASGKTRVAIELVKRFPCEIVSVDSAMIYRGMDIGTAKPDAETLETAPHRLIDFLDPTEQYSVADFRTDAMREMAEITATGKIPLLVGGTMLYFRALEQGLSVLPAADPMVRSRIDTDAREHGWSSVHRRLQQVDPVAAARIHPNDSQRIQRALEVYDITGVSMTELHTQGLQSRIPYRVHKMALIPRDRAILREKIATRLLQMLKKGLINEVDALYQRGDVNSTMMSMRAVGYRQVWEFLEGRLDYESMVLRAIYATRQLAKRQLTWLRGERSIERLGMETCERSDIFKALDAIRADLV